LPAGPEAAEVHRAARAAAAELPPRRRFRTPTTTDNAESFTPPECRTSTETATAAALPAKFMRRPAPRAAQTAEAETGVQAVRRLVRRHSPLRPTTPVNSEAHIQQASLISTATAGAG